jgi:hypothetical protein
MDVAAIMDLVIKGMGVISTLITVGQDAAPAIKVITDLVTGAQAGTVTDADLTATEATLDAMITDFNAPIA